MKFKLEISGMSCEHCVKFVRDVLGQIEGVTDVAAEINSAVITVNNQVTDSMLKEALEDAGYDLISIYPVLED